MPKVSVIMGIYNTNNKVMVKKAIDSIINQSFSDFEFIICDDGSSDNTYEIVSNQNNVETKDSLAVCKMLPKICVDLNYDKDGFQHMLLVQHVDH